MQRIRDRLKNVGNWMAHPDGTDVWLLERAELGSASVDVCVERVAEGTYRLKSIRSFDAATYHVESYDFNEVGVTFSWFDPKLGTSKAAGTTIIPMP
ncbi:MAG: hypothetical protein HYR72_27130 [Deltaproteobacteria bacterium]|nr:hypothetical protein [Deltaproteobacteria bacterium]MBI3390311.1 hypothetical protein [Deltaproteobacteria bacterium]